MSSINQTSILTKFLKAENLQKRVSALMENKVETEKRQLIKDFDEHPVTKEIQAGPDLPRSQILPGGYGNLFSFLGFARGQEPISPLRDRLFAIQFVRKPRVTTSYWEFKVRVPSLQEIEKVTPMHWESGRSWVDAVTRGLSGFSHYMFSLSEGRFRASRGGTAIQVKPSLRASAEYFAGVGYIIGMLGEFKRKISRTHAKTV